MRTKKRPILREGWAWEDGKTATAWGPGAMCSWPPFGVLRRHGKVPSDVVAAVEAAHYGARGSC